MGCVSIITRTGLPCGCRINDDGDKCGRHGGLTRNQAIIRHRRRYVHDNLLQESDPQDLEALIDDFQDIRIKVKVKLVILESVDKYYCGICCENVDSKGVGIQLKCCKKKACKECLERWINTNPSCPYCRKSIVC